MQSTTDAIAALLLSAAVLFVAIAGVAAVVAAPRIRERAVEGAFALVAAAVALRALPAVVATTFAGVGHELARLAPSALGVLPGTTLAILGHITLALVLLGRALRPNASVERAEAAARDRIRVRRTVPIRNEEVER